MALAGAPSVWTGRLMAGGPKQKSEKEKGSESGVQDGGVNSLRDSLNVCPGSGPDVQKRDDMAPRRTRSATSFDLPYGSASVANEALRTLLT